MRGSRRMTRATVALIAFVIASGWIGLRCIERAARCSSRPDVRVLAAPTHQFPEAYSSPEHRSPVGRAIDGGFDRSENVLSPDPSDSLRALLSRPEGRMHLREAFSALAREFGRDALEFVAVLHPADSTARFEACSGVINWALRGGQVDLAREWLQHVPDDLRVRVAANIADSWSASNTERTAWWVAELPECDDRARIIAALIDHWATRAPNDAEHFIRYMPESSARREMLAALHAHQGPPVP